MPRLNVMVENLARAQAALLRAADGVSVDQWKTSPGAGRWSAAELVCHLMTVERAVIRSVDKQLQKPAKQFPFYNRFHIPMPIVECGLIRRKSPLPLEPQLIRRKEEMLAELWEVRVRTLAFIGETVERDLSKYHMPHAFPGNIKRV
jgi:hypothetical protein